MTALTRTLARWLRRWAQRLDPQPTVAERTGGGGWVISMQGLPLAEVTPGQIRDTR